MSLGTCHAYGCQGHLGKFDDCWAEALYGLDMISGADEQFGDADGWGSFFSVFRFEQSEDVPVDVDGPTVPFTPGLYVLITASTGRVTMIEHHTPEEIARGEEDLARIRQSWEAWDTDGNEEA